MPDIPTQKSKTLQNLSDRLSTTLQQKSGHKRGGRGRKAIALRRGDTGNAEGTTTITIRVSHAEKQELKRLADAQGDTLTDYLKERIIRYHRPKVDIPVVNRNTYRTLSNIRRDLLRAAKGIEATSPGFGPDDKTQPPAWAIAFHKHLKTLHKLISQLQADLGGDNS